MKVLPSHIDRRAPQFSRNREAYLALIAKLESHLTESQYEGRHVARAHNAGKMTSRERIEALLDPGSFFLELMPLVGLGGRGFGPGGTNVCGVGVVSGQLCMISANTGTHKGGAIDEATLRKSLRIGRITLENRLPTINLVESAGANLPEQHRIFNFGGAIFRDIARRSRAGLTTVSVVFGNSTAGGAYVPGMSDHAVLVDGGAKVFLAGPPLVKQATGEIATEEELGGARMHCRESGVGDYLADDESHGIQLARDIMTTLPPPAPRFPVETVEPPKYSAEDLLGLINVDVATPFDARELIARVVDGSRFLEFKRDFGTTLVTGWAKVHGYRVGIIANNGVLFADAANKGAQFVQLCNHASTPILFLQNVPGFMVGSEYERDGIIKHGAKLINTVANTDVPTITVLVGASFGAGNYAMNGLAFEPNFLFSYPSARIAVMGSEQLSGVMEEVQMAAAKKRGVEVDPKVAAQMRQTMIAAVEEKSNAWYATGQGWDDGVIDPRDTRAYLGICLAIVNNQKIEGTRSYGVFRM